ncbi:Hypothetical protein NTJ_03554 [Nesidiocoris tenuis]|uniref:Uncharacterized protein n=1 Tax=Nesidiocoris tenuis TaxID=355587 RepID=A0ABN7AEP3_9HEMI|nr:Hypothetical protein NTJ_03554 [Nesidiocoris tenuis]
MGLVYVCIIIFVGLAVPTSGESSGPYPPAGKYPPAVPDPGPAPGPSGPAPTGPSGPLPSGPGPSGPGPAPFSGPSGPGPFPFGGPSGPGPFPFGPFPGPFPGPFFPPPPGPYGGPASGSICATLDRFRWQAGRLAKPLLAGGLGAAFLWAVKSLVIPNIALVATVLRRQMGIDEVSALDRISNEVSRAISNGICVEKVACALGKAAVRNYPTARQLVSIIDPKTTGFMSDFTSLFQRFVMHEDEDCELVKCQST